MNGVYTVTFVSAIRASMAASGNETRHQIVVGITAAIKYTCRRSHAR